MQPRMRAPGSALAPLALALAIAPLALVAACGDNESLPPPGSGPVVTTERCSYVPVVPTARAGGTVAAGPLTAGAAERVLHIPVGTALGGYTGRAGIFGAGDNVDARQVAISGAFNPSIGVTTAPRVKALALTAGGETVVLVKADMIFAYEGLLFELEQRLGPDFAGKVLLATSHSHSAWAQFTAHGPLKLGAGQQRALVYRRFLDDFEAVAREALGKRVPARIGVFQTAQFDPADLVNRDRRPENDGLPGGDRGEDHLSLLRVDAVAGAPIAIVPIFGQHATLNDQDNPLASADATGALERALEEQFDAPVVVMHLQGAGADTSAVGHGGLDCTSKPGKATDPCFGWTAEEGHGIAARVQLLDAWVQAGAAMRDSIELEMVTRSIETGPFPETFAIRGGALRYAAFDGKTRPDGVIRAGAQLASPIDEFNAPVGAALCESETAQFPRVGIPGTEGLAPYGSCLRLDLAAPILGPLFDIDFGVDEQHPVCETTRTTISALRIGDVVLATLPGEVSVLLADLVRQRSPRGEQTIVVGYAQGHVGYMLRPEDWVLGGYEPSVTFWGPLEAEHIAEQLLDLIPLALTPAREDAAVGGTTRVAVPAIEDHLEIDRPAPSAGTVPPVVPAETWARTGTPAQAQPAAQVPRVAGIATFVWIGDDPLVRTPRVTLEHETGPGTGVYLTVARRSGRPVEDGELVLAYTPSPLQRSGPQTHVWVVEWQAVPWVGAPGLAGLDARAGVALGRYRFHVEGEGWTLDSQPFDVIAGGLVLDGAQRAGGAIRAAVKLSAPKGWRLLDESLPSNQPVPVRGQDVTIALLDGSGGTLASAQVTTDGSGVAQVLDDGAARAVRITDRFGNQATAALP
jgi:neutral ceramidase